MTEPPAVVGYACSVAHRPGREVSVVNQSCGQFAAAGSQNVIVVPCPAELCASMRPPWASTSALAMASPSPAPPRSRLPRGVDPVETLEDQRQVLGARYQARSRRPRRRAGRRRGARRRSRPSPRGACRMALSRRLSQTCARRSGSPLTQSDPASPAHGCNCTTRSAASGARWAQRRGPARQDRAAADPGAGRRHRHASGPTDHSPAGSGDRSRASMELSSGPRPVTSSSAPSSSVSIVP